MILRLVSGALDDQPIWWQNFIDDIDKNYYHIRGSSQRIDNIYNAILEAGATVVLRDKNDRKSICGMDFEDDSKATWFILRWS
jgi:hypothetical protein